MRAREKGKANKRVCYPEMLASSHAFGCGISLRASDRKPRDYPTSERSHTRISCLTHTMRSGREMYKLCFLRIGPRGKRPRPVSLELCWVPPVESGHLRQDRAPLLGVWRQRAGE